jgi:NADPH:quinone reductase-like Zn-dependent oxidoreductase
MCTASPPRSLPWALRPGSAEHWWSARSSFGEVDAYVDTFGSGNVDIAILLGVDPARITTTADGLAAQRYGTRTDAQEEADTPEEWEAIAELVRTGQLVVPIQQVFPLTEVQAAYRELAKRHARGKLILRLS